jgi:histidine triad (HIT) family protein
MGCLFCDGVPDETILETDDLIVYLSLEGHPMVVPRRHIRDVFELDDQTASAILPLAAKLARALKASMNCEGVTISQVNGIAAGQEVFHFHLHVVPRWEDDGKGFVRWDRVTEDERHRRAKTLRAALSGDADGQR